MNLILIRGVPGTGKTIVSEILGKIFFDSEIICADKFKIQAMKENSFKEAQKIAYAKTLEKLHILYEQNKRDVILEELICDKNFYESLRNFITKTNSKAYWFRLLRPLDKLLELESNRNRKVKNNKEDFDNLKKEIELIKIPNEVLIKNDNLALTIKRILDVI